MFDQTARNKYWSWSKSIIGALLTLSATAANDSDLIGEAALRDALSDQLPTAERVMLKSQGQEFLTVYRRVPNGKVRGIAILLPGRTAHPESREVIWPLATGLVNHGWETLALQLPIPFGNTEKDRETISDQAVERIKAALTFVREQGINNPVLVGHDYGANIAARYLGTQDTRRALVRKAVFIGMPIEMRERQRGTLSDLRKIKVPVLDLFGSNDLPEVHDLAAERLLAARDAANAGYRQTIIPGVDHEFTGATSVLITRVAAWLNGSRTIH